MKTAERIAIFELHDPGHGADWAALLAAKNPKDRGSNLGIAAHINICLSGSQPRATALDSIARYMAPRTSRAKPAVAGWAAWDRLKARP